ncbi:alpha/beta fold hydrolase [Nocardia stercoris]|uniref:Alpha/beta fold hydrolase n=1 Tax=Nocardia stercoris TaxID=2483361 RepID=A0A3M2L6N7_9NOCA|nr:alpha/beta fold hydrolase [Nocardia stercoris]RMI33319.1 alpha/beta fold hydrolase [Nocardia stercoris]
MTARLTTFTNDGLTFDVHDDGPADGTPVVLLHGFPQTSASWARVTPHLHAAGYRTIVPDQRGYSPGARPRGRYAYRMSALVGDVAALIDTLGAGPVHLVGHDWGAAVAWSTAANRPHLVATLTSVSVPHPMAFVRSIVSSSQGFRSIYMAVFQIPWLPELVLTRMLRAAATGGPQRRARAMAAAHLDDEQFDRLLRDIVDGGALPYALNWYRAMAITTPRSGLAKVAAPTTHVWSTRDAFIARRSADLAARYVTGPYRIEVLDATHWVPEERPAELAALIVARARGDETT